MKCWPQKEPYLFPCKYGCLMFCAQCHDPTMGGFALQSCVTEHWGHTLGNALQCDPSVLTHAKPSHTSGCVKSVGCGLLL